MSNDNWYKSQGELPLIEHAHGGQLIRQRAKDGYINATAMCQAAGKRWTHYRELATTQAYLGALSAKTGIPSSELIQSLKGGDPKLQGTWVHPQVAIHLAQWLSPEFAVQVSEWVFEWFSGGPKVVERLPYHLRRYVANMTGIPSTHFSMLQEMTYGLIAPMTIEDIQAYEAKHPVGTKARLALALALYTLQRKSDIILFGKQHVRTVTGDDGTTQKRLRFRQHKNRNSKPVDIDIPILKELDDIISASPCGELTFLVTQFGQPFTANGFDNRFRKWAREAGVEKSMHGLRKAGGALLADKGCTTQEIMAVGGWLTMKEVERYTRSATRRTLATSAMQKVGQCAS